MAYDVVMAFQLRWFRVAAAGLLVLPWLLAQPRSQDAGPIVYVVSIHGTIDLGLSPLLARVLSEAHGAGAAAVLLDINTFGGRVDAAVAMRDSLLNAPLPTVAFINQRAISAGALIALACEKIYMVEGGTIGAAAPVISGVGTSEPADEKSVSYVRTEFRATAETRNRPPELAEAMVDADVEIEDVIEQGKLLTLTATDAVRLGVADQVVPTADAALEAIGIVGATQHPVRENWAELFVRFLTGPVISSLLMSVGVLGLLIELRTPGFGVPGATGVLALGLFLWGHWIVQLAGWEEILLLGVGLGLLLLEALVIPGFGLAGGLGLLAIVGALGLTLVGEGATVAVIMRALGQASVSILIAIGAAVALMRFLPRLPFGRRLVLGSEMDADLGYASAPAEDRQWLGRTGATLSPLRPAGVAEIEGRRVDVVSDGTFIEAGAGVEVIRVDGNRVVVRRASARQEETE
jgi:membrane-bound serine protease (ClpP class)